MPEPGGKGHRAIGGGGMSRCVRINADILNDRMAQTMPAAAFKDAFYAAAAGQGGPLADFVRQASLRPSRPVWARLRTETFARDDYTCQYCGERGGRLECDHVIPISRGGSSDPSNLTTACYDCNQSKRARTPDEWRAA